MKENVSKKAAVAKYSGGGIGLILFIVGLFLVGTDIQQSRAVVPDFGTVPGNQNRPIIALMSEACYGPRVNGTSGNFKFSNAAFPDYWNKADKGSDQTEYDDLRKANSSLPAKAPTRCLNHNRNGIYDKYDTPKTSGFMSWGVDVSPTRDNLPWNDELQEYPTAGVVPSGYPVKGFWPDATAPRPFLLPGEIVPFPGWPYQTIVVSKWDSKRATYKDHYVSIGGGTLPGQATPTSAANTGWAPYQIHHILEQQYGGGDLQDNLVPLITKNKRYPSYTVNIHQKYTTWWEHITTDKDSK